jgi:hypothetical protein
LRWRGRLAISMFPIVLMPLGMIPGMTNIGVGWCLGGGGGGGVGPRPRTALTSCASQLFEAIISSGVSHDGLDALSLFSASLAFR